MNPDADKKVTVEQLLSQIQRGHFLEPVFAQETNWNERLDARDADSFAAHWSDSYKRLNDRSSEESERVRDIREWAFKETYRMTQNADLAGYVSDDLGLIAKALDNNVEDEFITQLWVAYSQGIFPG